MTHFFKRGPGPLRASLSSSGREQSSLEPETAEAHPQLLRAHLTAQQSGQAAPASLPVHIASHRVLEGNGGHPAR